ncbi:MAG: pyridoxal-phosphate dependent enzyme [Planctomycetota bacterium]
MAQTLLDQLHHEILLARQRVYAVREPTPLEPVDIGADAEVWVKREDIPPIHAYKWRGAYNKMASLPAEERSRGVVCASAGNHAQGVAIAAKELGCHATIFMPEPTPLMKRQAVALHGGSNVTVELTGDTYDEASDAAKAYAQKNNAPFVHPYDDLVTMGGQGTIADEVVTSTVGPFDVAYLQIGGGGMAAAVGAWLKKMTPGIKIVGVEGEGQASMKAAIEHGGPVRLDDLDIFCDGTAVRRAGDLTYELCKDVVDEFITVSNEEVCNAIRLFWEDRRRIVEPAGAMGIAGMLKHRDQLRGQRVLGVMCGANMDFAQLAVIAAEAGIGGQMRKHIRFEIGEKPGTMLSLIDNALAGCNIVDFQYGKTNETTGMPVIGFDAPPEVIAQVHEHCQSAGIPYQDITAHEDVDFRIVNYDPKLFKRPLIIRYRFPERPGALHEFLQRIQGLANLCYFNYLYTGERIGRALVGLEFGSDADRQAMLDRLQSDPKLRHSYREVSQEVLERMLS